MKKHSFLIVLLLSFTSPVISQNIDSVYWAKYNLSMYSDCGAMKFLYQIPKFMECFPLKPICKDNSFGYKMIEVRTADYKYGWVDIDDLGDSTYFILKKAEADKSAEKKRIEKLKNDSINAEVYKFLHSKQIWITEVSAKDYGSQSAGIVVKFLNTSTKTIKYINFTAVPYNQVHDPVIDDIGKSFKACQLIGPILPDGDATYQTDILFFSSIVSYYKLKNISVQYMDNSVIYFNYKDILLKQ